MEKTGKGRARRNSIDQKFFLEEVGEQPVGVDSDPAAPYGI